MGDAVFNGRMAGAGGAGEPHATLKAGARERTWRHWLGAGADAIKLRQRPGLGWGRRSTCRLDAACGIWGRAEQSIQSSRRHAARVRAGWRPSCTRHMRHTRRVPPRAGPQTVQRAGTPSVCEPAGFVGQAARRPGAVPGALARVRCVPRRHASLAGQASPETAPLPLVISWPGRPLPIPPHPPGSSAYRPNPSAQRHSPGAPRAPALQSTVRRLPMLVHAECHLPPGIIPVDVVLSAAAPDRRTAPHSALTVALPATRVGPNRAHASSSCTSAVRSAIPASQSASLPASPQLRS